MQVHAPHSDYHCPTCSLSFQSNETYKIHYKSDFHRYNLKRKMVKLPPVTLQQFSTKKIEIKEQEVQELFCGECRKKFNSVNTFNQHVQSKGHNPNKIIEEKAKIVKPPLPFIKNAAKCLFCQHISSSLEDNLAHMSRLHSFFVPQRQFCSNLGGIIEYLQEKIEVGNLCINCDNKKAKDFASADAVRKHMNDKGHTFMKTEEGYEEYEKYYDFSSQFEEKLKQQSKTVPGIEYQQIKVYVEDDSSKNVGENEEEDWEDQEIQEDQEWESEDEEDQNENEKEHQIKQKKKQKVKTYNIMKPTLTSTDELLLPNGKILGHRKYRYLYRQNYRFQNWMTNRLKCLTNSQGSNNALINRNTILDILKRQKVMKREFLRDTKRYVKLGVNNNALQHHFRIQNSM